MKETSSARVVQKFLRIGLICQKRYFRTSASGCRHFQQYLTIKVGAPQKMKNQYRLIVRLKFFSQGSASRHYFSPLYRFITISFTNYNVLVHFKNTLYYKTYIGILSTLVSRTVNIVTIVQNYLFTMISNATKEFLANSGVSILRQSAYSPDLNMCDRYMFRAIKHT